MSDTIHTPSNTEHKVYDKTHRPDSILEKNMGWCTKWRNKKKREINKKIQKLVKWFKCYQCLN